MRITITCESCGHRHPLERSILDEGPIWVICHRCEIPLRAVFDRAALRSHQFESVWNHVFDWNTETTADAESARRTFDLG